VSEKLEIVIGATVDANLERAVAPIITAAKRARKSVQTEMDAAGASMSKSTQKGAKDASGALGEIGNAAKAATKQTSTLKSVADGLKSSFNSAARSFLDMANAAESAFDRVVRGAEKVRQPLARDAKGKFLPGGGKPKHFFKESLGDSMGELGGVASRAGRWAVDRGMRLGSDVASGSGINFGMSSNISKETALNKAAIDLTNSGFMSGAKGANGRRQDSGALIEEVRAKASATGMGVNDAMEGLQAFVGKTGDLQAGRDLLADLAKLSKATGTELSDMQDAAGDVFNLPELEGNANKLEIVKQIMTSIAGQGKLGAVEIKDLATQMAKLAAASGKFGGPGAAREMAIMGALAQEARQHGGAHSAASAATAVGSFTNVFSKNARLEKFKKYGVDIYDKAGKKRAADDIIIDSLKASERYSKENAWNPKDRAQMRDVAMGQMFMDANARKVTSGFEKIYNEAGGGDAGAKAVREEFERLAQAAMGAGEVTESFNRAMQSTESQVNKLNNDYQAASLEMQKALLPAILALAPALTDATKAAAFLFQTTEGAAKERGGIVSNSEQTIAEIEKRMKSDPSSITMEDRNRLFNARGDIETQKTIAQTQSMGMPDKLVALGQQAGKDILSPTGTGRAASMLYGMVKGDDTFGKDDGLTKIKDIVNRTGGTEAEQVFNKNKEAEIARYNASLAGSKGLESGVAKQAYDNTDVVGGFESAILKAAKGLGDAVAESLASKTLKVEDVKAGGPKVNEGARTGG
jgi:hypothetical protein